MATTTDRAGAAVRPVSLQLPGLVLGVGLGRFVDGILLHQVLQWHHMLSSTNSDNIGVRYYSPHTVSGAPPPASSTAGTAPRRTRLPA
ncbi:DUF2243 domain-containing protein [Actinopolymorpha pittospori]|uniref:DUF2243 domain-containing protein n=1 Tax=Actinopolymorpha pittospori TaxID=648752 RepID=A0A927N470_9ACTN|nr:DUF2243 domain-containing protein [Actinopolymorpha pittospori]MBE1608637.1 hypothetical protein [Actinopolymorpha pittospori]